MSFDTLITKSAEEIRNGSCDSRSKLLIIYEKLTLFSDEEKDLYKYHIERIANTIEEIISASNENILTRAERDQAAFPFEWRIHERISNNNNFVVTKRINDDLTIIKEITKLIVRLNEVVSKLTVTENHEQFLEAFIKTLHQERSSPEDS